MRNNLLCANHKRLCHFCPTVLWEVDVFVEADIRKHGRQALCLPEVLGGLQDGLARPFPSSGTLRHRRMVQPCNLYANINCAELNNEVWLFIVGHLAWRNLV